MTPEPEPCKPCQIARQVPAYPFFNLGCLYCGARLIQRLGGLPIARSQVAERRRENLAHWVAFGHSEAELRSLAKGSHCVGPVPTTVCAPQTLTKRR